MILALISLAVAITTLVGLFISHSRWRNGHSMVEQNLLTSEAALEGRLDTIDNSLHQAMQHLERLKADEELILERIRTVERDRTGLRTDLQALFEQVSRHQNRLGSDLNRTLDRVRQVEADRTKSMSEIAKLQNWIKEQEPDKSRMPTDEKSELSLTAALDDIGS